MARKAKGGWVQKDDVTVTIKLPSRTLTLELEEARVVHQVLHSMFGVLKEKPDIVDAVEVGTVHIPTSWTYATPTWCEVGQETHGVGR